MHFIYVPALDFYLLWGQELRTKTISKHIPTILLLSIKTGAVPFWISFFSMQKYIKSIISIKNIVLIYILEYFYEEYCLYIYLYALFPYVLFDSCYNAN